MENWGAPNSVVFIAYDGLGDEIRREGVVVRGGEREALRVWNAARYGAEAELLAMRIEDENPEREGGYTE